MIWGSKVRKFKNNIVLEFLGFRKWGNEFGGGGGGRAFLIHPPFLLLNSSLEIPGVYIAGDKTRFGLPEAVVPTPEIPPKPLPQNTP